MTMAMMEKEGNNMSKPDTKKWMSMLLKDEKNIKNSDVTKKARVMTPSHSLNWALGGGVYRGYTTCFYGPEGSGKSLLSMMSAGALMQSDPDAIVVTISTEMRAPVPEKVAQLGVDPERHIIREVNTIHDVFDWISSDESNFKNSDGSGGGPGLLYMLKEGAPIKGIIIDSIKGIRGPKEIGAETAEKENMGDLSKFLNPALRQVLPVFREYDIMAIFVQQVNMNLNADEVKYQNKKYVLPSGQAIRHFCETMALVERVTSKDSKIFSEELSSLRDTDLQEGHTVRVKVEKANLDSPHREAEFVVKYNQGIVNRGAEVFKLAKGTRVIIHPLNDKGSPINTQYVWVDPKTGEVKKKWIGEKTATDEIEKDPELQRQIAEDVTKKTG